MMVKRGFGDPYGKNGLAGFRWRSGRAGTGCCPGRLGDQVGGLLAAYGLATLVRAVIIGVAVALPAWALALDVAAVLLALAGIPQGPPPLSAPSSSCGGGPDEP